MSRPPMNKLRGEYAYWLATPRRLRVTMGLPITDSDFAEMKSVSSRTLRRWKEDQDFLALVEQHRLELANAGPNSAIAGIGVPVPAVRSARRVKPEVPRPVTLEDDPALVAGVSVDEQRYLQVKDTLVQMAMDGNQGAIDLYLKHYGKNFVEAEKQDFRDYEGFSEDRLADEVLEWVGVEHVSRWLAERVAVEA